MVRFYNHFHKNSLLNKGGFNRRDESFTHLSDVDFAILVVVVGLHKAGLELLQHGVGYSLESLNSKRLFCRALVCVGEGYKDGLKGFYPPQD